MRWDKADGQLSAKRQSLNVWKSHEGLVKAIYYDARRRSIDADVGVADPVGLARDVDVARRRRVHERDQGTGHGVVRCGKEAKRPTRRR